MGKKWERTLSEAIGLFGVHINSALVSAQNRKRIYWTNIRTKQMGLFGDVYSDIPQPKDKGILLRDILESDVPDKYYLSEKAIATVNRKSDIGINPKINPDKSGTVTCGNQSAKFSIDNSTTLIVASRGRNPENPKSRESGLNTEQMLEPRYDGKTNCLTSVQKDNLVLLNERQKANHKNEDEKANTFLSTSWKSSQANGMTLVGTTKIRRLTPTECERLQTVPDGYTSIVSDTQRYRMLGNGWTVDVIAHIFSFMALQKPKSEGEKNIIAE